MRSTTLIDMLDVRPLIRRWYANSALIKTLKEAPRAELEQALLRVAIPAAVVIYIGIDIFFGASLTSEKQNALFFAVGFLVFAIVLAVFVVLAKGNPAVRRLFGIFVDNAANTIYLLIAGEAGAFVFGIYLFVTFGNGFRYGQFYLRVSHALFHHRLLDSSLCLAVLVGAYSCRHRLLDRTIGLALLCRCTCGTNHRGQDTCRRSQSSQRQVLGEC